MKYLKIQGQTGTILDYKNFIVTKDDTLLCISNSNVILEKVPAGKWIQANVRSSDKKLTAKDKFMQPLKPSEYMAKLVGPKPISRIEVVKKLWKFIKDNNLQDSKNRRMINVGKHEITKDIFRVEQISMFDMTKVISKHLK